MRTRIQQLRHDERGMSMVFVGMGFMAFLAATTLAIDVGMFMTARSQAQNSADAGALAGATALVFNDYDNRTASGPVVQSAVNTALSNDVMRGDVSVRASDVTFPTGPTGLNNRVRVNVFRTSGRTNPVSTLFGVFFAMPTVDIGARATAEASPANAVTCVKPFTIPDRWREADGTSSDESDTFDRYDNAGNLLPAPRDEYYDATHAAYPGYTGRDAYRGYDATRDKGLELTIRAGTGSNIAPSFYWSWAMPGGTGGSWYEENIYGCNGTSVTFGQQMTQEPGNMVGPTNHGIDELIAQDPSAYWNDSERAVYRSGQPAGNTPRVFPIPMYNPDVYAEGRASGRGVDLRVANWVGFFVVRRDGNNVIGRITPVTGIIDGSAGPSPVSAFPKAIRLVE
jgi:Flp pilus assembly protein TadG